MRMHSAIMLAVFVCTASVALLADYRDAYRRGVIAARNNQWPAVVRAMREAIAEKPQDSDELINIAGFGDRVVYTPYYYLGLGLYRTKDCGAALDAWQTSETQGGLKRVSSGDRNNVAKFRKECEGRVAAAAAAAAPKPSTPAAPAKPTGPDPAAVNAAITNAENDISRAAESERLAGQLSTDPMLSKVWRSEGGLAAAEQRARESLAKARGELDAGRREPNLQRLQEAASLATSAAEGFDAVRKTATTRREQLIAEAKPKPMIEERPATPPAPPPTPATPPVAATAKPESAKPAAAAANPAAQPFTPPAPLAAAARLFFRSQYQEAAASLARLRYDSGPEAGHAALLRAATQYSLYLVGGERDSKLLDEARRGVTEVRRLAPSLRPDPKAFSPRFVEFFASVR